MKIVFLLQASSSVLKGGAELQADYIIRELLKHNPAYDICYVSDLIKKESGPRIENVRYVFLKSHGTKYSFLNTVPLVRILKDLDPDIVYQRWRTPYTGIAAWYTVNYGKKLIFEIASDQDLLKNRIPLNRNFAPKWISERFSRYGLRRADVIVCQSRDQQSSLKRVYGLESLLIPKGHPVPQGPFVKSSTPVVIWVANIKPLKQPEIFLELARSLAGIRAEFVLVGRPDTGAFQTKIVSRAEGLPNVRYIGELSQDETNDLIASSSLLVNTSLYEGIPNTFIQAWMRETPVVSLNIDPDDVMTRERIGFRSRTFDQLVNNVRFLLENEQERAAQGRKARQYAVENHDIHTLRRKYIELFEGLAPRDQGKPLPEEKARE